MPLVSPLGQYLNRDYFVEYCNYYRKEMPFRQVQALPIKNPARILRASVSQRDGRLQFVQNKHAVPGRPPGYRADTFHAFHFNPQSLEDFQPLFL
jgi:hypothetical protein